MAKLLLLDDDAQALVWMVTALEQRGHEVRGFTRPSAALEELHDWTPDLIVSDISMSELNGLEFARLTRRCRGVPLMFVSVARQRAEAVIAGAVGYVQKPATAEEVRSEVERVLGRRDRRCTILVVDDDPAARWVFHSFLDPHFDVLDAEHGAKALELLGTHHVDLAIIDVHMPVMSGAELIRRVRCTPGLEHLPIIVQTGDRSAIGAPVWRDLHIAHVIEKNEFLDWFASRIDSHLKEGEKASAPVPWRRPGEDSDTRERATRTEIAPGNLDRAALAAISTSLTEVLPFGERLEKLVACCREAADAERAVLVLDQDGLFVRATVDASSNLNLVKRPIAESDTVPVLVVEEAFNSREPVLLEDALQDDRYAVDSYVSKHRVRSVLAAPIVRANITIGAIYLESNSGPSVFTSELAETFRLLSPFIAVALDNSRLSQDLEETTAQRETIRKLVMEREELLRCALFLADATRLLASLEFEEALDGVVHLAVPFLGDGCAIDVFDGESRRFVAVSPKSTSALSLEVHPSVLRGKALIYELGSVSHIGVPILVAGRLMGAITLSASYERTYTRTELELTEELARRTALSIENARLYRQARDAVKERDEFLSIAAHEIRGPINSIHLAVQSIRQSKVPQEALPRLFELVERQDRRLSQFVDELLDLGRIRAGVLKLEYQEVDLGEVIAEVAVRLGPEATLSGSPLTVTAQRRIVGRWDKSRLDQVVQNLLSNAVKFGLGKPIEVTIGSQGERASITVRDHGVGMDRETLQRIFRPFERGVSSRQYGGLGLGLHIVKTIVDALGGSVSVESEPGQGSAFRVELPLPQPGDNRHAHSHGR